MAFSAAYGDGLNKHDTDEWMEGTSAALREAGFKSTRRLGALGPSWL